MQQQTRILLIAAWLMAATLLWMEWGKERQAAAQPATTAATAPTVPSMVPGATSVPGNAPVATVPAPTNTTVTASANVPVVTVSTDLLRLQLAGGSVRQAELLAYPQTRAKGSPPVKLFNPDPARYYEAQSGWIGQGGSLAPNHENGFVPLEPGKTYALANGTNTISVPFVWHGANGVEIRRVYTLTRGRYAVDVKDTVVNAGSAPWSGYIYRQLVRVPPQVKASMFEPESYSFRGATWYSPEEKYERRAFSDKFLKDGKLDRTIQGGWLAMPQHHFLTAWIPQENQAALYTLDQRGSAASIGASGPQFSVAPGQQVTTDARLWVGPKLISGLQAEKIPQFDRAVDYSRFSIFAMMGKAIFWFLSELHKLLGNWGWAIVALVVILKLVLFPLSNAQYKSAAKMRKFQPRMKQLQERYGDDKPKLQQAMMELYKTEKINPAAGCLPIIPQILIFMTLYWVLAEAVELRHAPWIGWIQDLTARDPYFILPVLNAAIMWTTQHLTPVAPGMDPMQQKMMKMMPLVFGVMLAFLPAGLVLYQVVNGGLGLIQQWYMLKKYADEPAKPAVSK